MKKLCVTVVAMLIINSGFSQEQPKKKDTRAARVVQQQAPAARKATGPLGYGPIRLGMTKPALEALQATDNIYVSSSLTAYTSKDPQPEGSESYKGLLMTPLRDQPFDASFIFTAGQLSTVLVKLDEQALADVTKQISERYGAGKTEDTRKEQQCIYGNGANFKITDGELSTTWSTPVSSTGNVETELLDAIVDSCPSNLRYGSTGSFRYHSLYIHTVSVAESKKKGNLF